MCIFAHVSHCVTLHTSHTIALALVLYSSSFVDFVTKAKYTVYTMLTVIRDIRDNVITCSAILLYYNNCNKLKYDTRVLVLTY